MSSTQNYCSQARNMSAATLVVSAANIMGIGRIMPDGQAHGSFKRSEAKFE
jgi:hypothetical protein